MTWRTVVVSSNSKLDLRLNYLVIRNSEIRKVHLSEISVLIIESTAVSMTAMLLCEMCRRGIKVVMCDETHNPYGELAPYYGSHDSARKLRLQIDWKQKTKDCVWSEIVRRKIEEQARVISDVNAERASMLRSYSSEVEPGDPTNREGHAAKVYFNTIFGEGFSRRRDCVTNSCLDYGYAIILSAVNREITACGYNTELGIFHNNVFNHFNLGSDLMEPLRPLVDEMVLKLGCTAFNSGTKRTLARVLELKVEIEGRSQYLNNAIPIYVKSVLDALTENNCSLMRFCKHENESDETDSLL